MKNGFLACPCIDFGLYMAASLDADIRYLYGRAELSENLACPLWGRGTAVWPVMARYPTLAAYVELLLDTPQFLRYSGIPQAGFPIILGHVLGRTCGMGICKVSFSREKDTLYLVYCPDADAISGDHGFSHLVLNKLGLIDTVWAVILPGADQRFRYSS